MVRDLPEPLRDDLSEVYGEVRVLAVLTGGSICSARRVEVGGRSFFLKYSQDTPAKFFAVEAAGLERLRAADSGLRVPGVTGFGDSETGGGWILLEWLESASASSDAWRKLGSGLARLHGQIGDRWGGELDGFIGSLPQLNTPTKSWGDFWIRNRLAPQFEKALATGRIGHASEWERLMGVIPEILARGDQEGPSLLHGDLWSGNVVHTSMGPAIVDPSCYWGHREVDLAMAELFGGFDAVCFKEYAVTWPFIEGYEVRRRIYQLYYLLVHVNLFGSTYAAPTVATLRSVLAGL